MNPCCCFLRQNINNSKNRFPGICEHEQQNSPPPRHQGLEKGGRITATVNRFNSLFSLHSAWIQHNTTKQGIGGSGSSSNGPVIILRPCVTSGAFARSFVKRSPGKEQQQWRKWVRAIMCTQDGFSIHNVVEGQCGDAAMRWKWNRLGKRGRRSERRRSSSSSSTKGKVRGRISEKWISSPVFTFTERSQEREVHSGYVQVYSFRFYVCNIVVQ